MLSFIYFYPFISSANTSSLFSFFFNWSIVGTQLQRVVFEDLLCGKWGPCSSCWGSNIVPAVLELTFYWQVKQPICIYNVSGWEWAVSDQVVREVSFQFPSGIQFIRSLLFLWYLDVPWQPHVIANLSTPWDHTFQQTPHEHLFRCLITGSDAAVFIIVHSDLYDVPIQTYLRVHLHI